ncbi:MULTISPECIES: hypothetical protein [unclassified Streptomyces]|uniref:hypothetical protein n=1 Tax=unclassified Streptomyces TaxID=2593676 RepID=UPI00166139CE|nr:MULTISPECIES: hypothetical protein [unclassified Streptomyces]MBD0712430.1 hypothetical protein [Streptomyces sp. CBMA291]MBD0716804.1 hypothetical protein [Streptomyces sp. CBMA370]
MAIIDELRTPLYFAAGTADLAVQQARKVPGLIEQLAAGAPARIDAVRNADPKAVQEKVTAQAKEAQATVQSKLADVVGVLDTDLKKLGETAQDLALRGVGVAAEYAVKAREKYEEVAAHGEETVKAWRGEPAEEFTEITVVVEPEEAEPVAEPVAETAAEPVAEPKAVEEPRIVEAVKVAEESPSTASQNGSRPSTAGTEWLQNGPGAGAE